MDLHPRLSVSGLSSWNWTLEQDLDFWSERAIKAVGIPMWKLEAAGWARSRELVAEAGVRVTSVASPRAFTLDDPDMWERERELLSRRLQRVAELGAPCLYITTGQAPRRKFVDEGIDAFAAAVRPSVDEAKLLGVSLAFEHNHVMGADYGCIHTLSDAIDVAHDTGLGIVVELQQCWLERRLPEVFRRGVDAFNLVQVSDFVVGTRCRQDRACPGDGDMPLEQIIRALLDVGYAGMFDLEILGPRVEKEGYRPAIDRSVAWTNDLLSRLGA